MTQRKAIITGSDRERLKSLLIRLRNWGHTPPDHLKILEERLESARVIDIPDLPHSIVTMNSLVGLRDLEFGEKFSCTLSYPEDADAVKRKLSVTLPLGSRLLGAREGDMVECPMPSGHRTLRIDRVYYQPEAARDFHL
jgi:regulator of nucleoside diphosphate kinase